MTENYRTKNEQENNLVLSMQRGDRQAFGSLYDKYAPLLLGILTKRIPDSKLSEEVLQELFVTIWNRIRDYDSSKHYLYTWMYTLLNELIVKNVSLRGKFPNDSKTSKGNHFVHITDNKVKGEVPAGKAFDLVYFKGYTYAEAARELKITLPALQAKIKIELNGIRGI